MTHVGRDSALAGSGSRPAGVQRAQTIHAALLREQPSTQ